MTQGFPKLATAAGLLLFAAACDDRPVQPNLGELDPQATRPATSDTIKSEQFRTWPASDRAAFLAGRVIAADLLFRAGVGDAALEQIAGATQRMMSVQDGELQALGFEPARMKALSAALELGRPAEEVTPLFAEAETNLSSVLSATQAAPEDVTAFLMRMSAEDYELGVQYGEIADARAYQSAYGYAVAARDLIAPLDEAVYGDLRLELDILVLMWPAGGPLTGRTPPPEMQMADQYSRVKLALAELP